MYICRERFVDNAPKAEAGTVGTLPVRRVYITKFYKFYNMSVRKKISVAFVILGLILLLSSVIAIFEFVTMKRTVAQFVTDDVESINDSRLLLEITDDYNFRLMEKIGDTTLSEAPALFEIGSDNRFKSYMSRIYGRVATEEERAMADSVRYAYIAYAHIIGEVPKVWKCDYSERREWFFSKLYPVYNQLRSYIGKLNALSQNALKVSSDGLNAAFYRSIMPCVVAVGIEILLLFLFNYYVTYYFLTPLELISKGIRIYRETGKAYDVNVESNDEMQTLNENVKEVIRKNKQLLKNNLQ